MPEKRRLAEPDWDALKGGSSENEWQEDRLRKVGKIKLVAKELAQLEAVLARRGALYRCSRTILEKHPAAGEWYLRLAGFAWKTLRNVQQKIKTDYGLSVMPETLVKKLQRQPAQVQPTDLDAFSRWINDELAAVLGEGLEDRRLAGLHVAMIAGGTVLGQGQNVGGSLAVDILKAALLRHFGPPSDWRYFKERKWADCEDDLESALAANLLLHEPSKTRLDFTPAGNRPDLKASRGEPDEEERVLLVGEVKGRKDLSNTWESWIPQVNSHLETWKTAFPNAYCGVFMTVFTEEMITGITPHSTEERRGLKKLFREEFLDYAINLSLLAVDDGGTLARFKELFGAVLETERA
jgi:hypothetical protein